MLRCLGLEAVALAAIVAVIAAATVAVTVAAIAATTVAVTAAAIVAAIAARAHAITARTIAIVNPLRRNDLRPRKRLKMTMSAELTMSRSALTMTTRKRRHRLVTPIWRPTAIERTKLATTVAVPRLNARTMPMTAAALNRAPGRGPGRARGRVRAPVPSNCALLTFMNLGAFYRTSQ